MTTGQVRFLPRPLSAQYTTTEQPQMSQARSTLAQMWANVFAPSNHLTLCRMVDMERMAYDAFDATGDERFFTLGCALMFAVHRLATE